MTSSPTKTVINYALLKEQMARAKESGQLIVQPTTLPPPPSAPEASARRASIKDNTASHLKLDFDLISAYLGVVLNPEVSPLRTSAILNRRLLEMSKEGSLKLLPTNILEMLKGLATPSFGIGDIKVAKRGEEIVIKATSPNVMTSRGMQVLLHSVSWRMSEDGTEITLKSEALNEFTLPQLQRSLAILTKPFPP